jgi:5-methylcytosine-specific restriction endonuclease McrA
LIGPDPFGITGCELLSKRHPPWNRLYDTARWSRRARHQLRVEPFCRACAARGEVTVACVVDHIEPHKGDLNKFWLGALQSLCFDCHNGEKRFEENRGFSNRIGSDGMPLDKNHPFYKGHL